jgi:hypothetical protein
MALEDRHIGLPSAVVAPYGNMQHLADAHNPQGIKDLQARLAAAEPARVKSWQARAAEAGWESVVGQTFTKAHESTFKGEEIVDLRLALAKAERRAQHWDRLLNLVEARTPPGGGLLTLGIYGRPGAYWALRIDGHVLFAGSGRDVPLEDAVEAAHNKVFGGLESGEDD